MRVDVGVILGTGFGAQMEGIGGSPIFVPSALGMMRGTVISHQGMRIMVVRRHAAGHRIPPHAVAYGAMALSLKRLGVRACLSTAAVGSLRKDWGPGTLVACSGLLDISGRNFTLFTEEVVHTDFSQPFAGGPRCAILETAAQAGMPVESNGVYVNANGPRYESPEEIEAYRRLGGDVVGMTAGSEAVVMQEAGVPYGCLAIVTNMAAGLAMAPLNHGEVVDAMQASAGTVWTLLLGTAKRLSVG